MAEIYLLKAGVWLKPIIHDADALDILLGTRSEAKTLSAKFGQFTFGTSLTYASDLGFWAGGVISPSFDYPSSPFYIESEIAVEKREDRYTMADDTLQQLEALFRVLQAGYISIRRHSLWTLIGWWLL